jgi:glycosyltransferase involved in cell wall biosynthesis
MNDRRYRTLLVITHPVQYIAPTLRLLAKRREIDLVVAYCSLIGAESTLDSDFRVKVAWDVPVLEGYSWLHVPNISPEPGLAGFFGLVNPGLWKAIRTGRFDVVINLTSYIYASFWITVAATKAQDLPLLLGIDATQIAPLDGKKWKIGIKKFLWPRLYGLADVMVVPSSGGVCLLRSLGIPAERIVQTAHSVDNAWWADQASRVNRSFVRANWRIPESAPVVLFCGKLQPWKRPQDALRAFAKCSLEGSYLVFAGDGPLRTDLEAEAHALGVAHAVRFLGFVNQSNLPAVYRSSDVLVLPSEYEAFGLVVNEAMLCGCPVIVSDRVGARFDLVREGKTGFIFPVNNLEALTALLYETLTTRDRLNQMANAAREQMKGWSPEKNVEGLIEAILTAVRFRDGSKTASLDELPD